MGLVGALRVGAGLLCACLCVCLASCSSGDGSDATGSRAGPDLEGSLDPISFDPSAPREVGPARPLIREGDRSDAGPASTSQGGAASETPDLPEPSAEDDGGAPGDVDTLDTGLSAAVEHAIATAMKRARERAGDAVTDRNTAVAVVAIDSGTGRLLVRRLSELPLVPASNLKLMTAAAALVELGADGAFVTPFLTDAAVEGGALRGDLVVRAGGDPLHRRDGDGGLGPWVGPLLDSLAAAGIERVDGALVLDEGAWLEPGPGPLWPAPSQHWRDYCGLSGGFSVNGGCFRATVTPRAAGERASVTLRPAHHGLTRKGTVTTAGSRVAVNVGANRSGVTVRGKIKAGSRPYVAEFSHPDPVDLFGHAVVGALADRGVTVSGGFRRERGVELRDPREVHVIRTPITEVMEAILLDSNNPVADQLFLAVGAAATGAGTRESGADAVRAALGRLGLNVRPLVQVDGSGLSKANRATAEQLAALVAAVVHQGGPVRSAIMDALPVAGRSGKLASRMRGTAAEGRVRAKTGWVKGASSLSGVAETEGGAEIVFSILVGYPLVDGLNTAAWKPMQDEICAALAAWPGDGAGR